MSGFEGLTVKEMIVDLIGKVDALDKAIRGNGTPGLRQEVDTLKRLVENPRKWMSGLAQLIVAGAVGGLLAVYIPMMIAHIP